jgi:hypothetical protein
MSTNIPVTKQTYNDLQTISRQHHHGDTITRDEFNKMKRAGQLDAFFQKNGQISFDQLDIDKSRAIDRNDFISRQDTGNGNDISGEVNGNGSIVGAQAMGNEDRPMIWDIDSETMTIHFGWSDTKPEKIKSMLLNAGIDENQFKMTQSADKGIGFVVIESPEQLNKFLAFTKADKKVFANQVVVSGTDKNLNDFDVEFSRAMCNADNRDATIGVSGGEDFTSIITDDPSKATRGQGAGKQEGDDGLWTFDNKGGDIKMYGGGHREYITMQISY